MTFAGNRVVDPEAVIDKSDCNGCTETAASAQRTLFVVLRVSDMGALAAPCRVEPEPYTSDPPPVPEVIVHCCICAGLVLDAVFPAGIASVSTTMSLEVLATLTNG